MNSIGTPISTPFALADAYKLSHWTQYPEGVTKVYSNFTPRKSRVDGVDEFVFFGLQAFLIKLHKVFETDFFTLSEKAAVDRFVYFYTKFFGVQDCGGLDEKVRALHKLGYLPLQFNALPEGSVVNHGIPVMTVENTYPDFYWLTNFIESWMSAELWHTCTSATTAREYKKVFDKFAKETSDAEWFTEFQGHDFSFRGLPGLEAAMASGAAHLLSFKGTDSCPAIDWINYYYHSLDDKTLIGTSVPATEHSVMCAGGEYGELETFRRLIEDCYPTGIVSIVSDTWDLWTVVGEILPTLKDKIMAREGKVVIRPDSSPKTPVEIICGDPDADPNSYEGKGLCQCLYEIFGGTKNSKGYIDLHPCIGMIYGDSITREYQRLILEGLKAKGFASTNIVLGIGSYTYQMVTRDTHGIAIKATAVYFGDKLVPIFKDPKTDNSGKKSARGLLQVTVDDNGKFTLHEDVSWEDCYENSCLKPLLIDGKWVDLESNPVDFEDVRQMLAMWSK